MQLSRLKTVTLKVADKEKQSNGTYIDTFTKIDDYRVISQDLTDKVSASIYGADLNKMKRLSSPKSVLEKYLEPKVNNEADNISKYYIFMNDTKYKITSVKENWIDIENA